MKLFKKKRKATINWMTVKCYHCDEYGRPRVMYVNKDEIKLKVIGYKGNFQAYVRCDKCGRNICIPNNSIPENIMSHLINKIVNQK